MGITITTLVWSIKKWYKSGMNSEVASSYNTFVGFTNAYIITSVILIPFEIYAIVMLYKLHKILYGKGTLWQIIGIYREFIISRIAFGKAMSVVYPIAWILGFLVGSVPESVLGTMNEGSLIGFMIFVEVICIILHILYGVGVVIAGAKCNQATQEKKYRTKMAKDLQNAFWWFEGMYATSRSETNTSIRSSNREEYSDDDTDDVDDYYDGL